MGLVTTTSRYVADDWPLAVVDGAAALGLGAELAVRPSNAAPLFERPADPGLLAVAPYLVRWSPEIAAVLEACPPDHPACAWLQTTAPWEEVRRHLRRFLSVLSPTGEVWYFRYYDPRVLPRFLATCHERELDEWFGPITCFGVGGESGTVTSMTYVRAVDKGSGARSPLVQGDQKPGNVLFPLRPEHLEVFAAEGERALIGRVGEHLSRHHSASVADLDSATLARRIAQALRRARARGIKTERALTIFVALMFEVAPDFDSHPIVARNLSREGESPDDGVLRLAGRTGSSTWQEAGRTASQSLWE